MGTNTRFFGVVEGDPCEEEQHLASKKTKLSIMPLGGLGEIGKNMTAVECDGDIVVIDCGLAFPDEEMFGVDLVIPDITYLVENRDRVLGILLTHGHEDHVGSLPYVLKSLPIPVFGTRLTLGLVQSKLQEHGLVLHEGSKAVHSGESVRLGCFQGEFFRVNHSIPDACGIALHSPAGVVVFTGDFKFDQTPVDGEVADIARLAELGDQGVLALFSDSTNAERPGYTSSESSVGRALSEVIGAAKQRVILATFASNVHRIQQIVTAAHQHGRKVAVVGRSMENVVGVATDLGYLKIPDGTLVGIDDMRRFPADQMVIISTGSQGEPMSALTRMSTGEHRKVEIVPGDTVVFSATPIPGNEKAVARTVDNLYRRGAQVIYDRAAGVHVSGHGSQEEQKLMLNLVRPKYFIPGHGEYRHLILHARTAESLGFPKENIILAENGSVIEVSAQGAGITGKVTSGKVLVDGLGVGDVGNIVLRDRKQLAEDGVIVVMVAVDRDSNLVVSGPDLVSRGFVYVRESERLMEEAKVRIRETLHRSEEKRLTDWSSVKQSVRDVLGKFLYDRTRRRPMILPIVIEV